MAKTDEITVQGYEAPDQVAIDIAEEIPSPPGGASRWAEFTEDKPVWGKGSVWGNFGERAKAVLPYLKDRLKQRLAYGYDDVAGRRLPGLAGKIYSALHGEEYDPAETADYDTEDGLSQKRPYNTQSFDEYVTKRRDTKPMTEDVMNAPGGMSREDVVQDYAARYNPSNEYANFTDTDVYANIDPDTYAGAVAKGVTGSMGDTLPEQLGAAAGDYATRITMATLGPAYIKAKNAIKRRDELINKLYKNKRDIPRVPYRQDGAWYDVDEIRDDLFSDSKALKNRLFVKDTTLQDETHEAIQDAMNSYYDARREKNLASEGRELFNRRYPSSWSHADGTRRPQDVLPTERANEFYKQMARDMRGARETTEGLAGVDLEDWDPNEYEAALKEALGKVKKTTAKGVGDALDDAVRASRTSLSDRKLSADDAKAMAKSFMRKHGGAEIYPDARLEAQRQVVDTWYKLNPESGAIPPDTFATLNRSVYSDINHSSHLTMKDAIKRALIRATDPYDLMDAYGTSDVLEVFEKEGLLRNGDTGWNYMDVLRSMIGKRGQNAPDLLKQAAGQLNLDQPDTVNAYNRIVGTISGLATGKK